MKFKRLTALFLCVSMIMSFIPCVSFAASTQGIIDLLGGEVLWSAPDGDFYDDDIADVFEGWSSSITEGYVNVRTYTEGTTIQYYVNGTDNITTITSPGYGDGAEKIIIEWKMRGQTKDELHLDFLFKDINGVIIAPLNFNVNETVVSDSYAMGYPALGTDCAIVAYNNADGTTHTAEYYVAGAKVHEKTALEGVVSGFKSIESSNGSGNTQWGHIGFADFTIGVVDSNLISVTATYKADEEIVDTKTLIYNKNDGGAVFEKENFYYNNDVWYSPETTLAESGDIELVKYDRYKTKNIGDTFEHDGVYYEVTGDSAIVNGNFITGDAKGWTNRLGTEITDYTIYYDSDFGNMISLSAGGKDATDNIGTFWSVTPGQKYFLSFYVTGNKPTSSNYVYNQVFQSDKSTSVLNYGERMNNNYYTYFAEIVEPTGDSLYFQCSWTNTINFGSFQLLPVEEATVKYTTNINIRDSYTDNILETKSVEKYAGEIINVADYAPEEATYNGNTYTKNEDNATTYTVIAGDNEVNIYYTTESYVALEYTAQSGEVYSVENNLPLLPQTVTAVKGTGVRETVNIKSWTKNFVDYYYNNMAYYQTVGSIEDSELSLYRYHFAYPNSFSLADTASVVGQTMADNSLTMFPEKLADQFVMEIEVEFEAFGDTWIVVKNSKNSGFFGPDQVLIGVDSDGVLNLVNGDGVGGKATSNSYLAALELNKPYRILINADPLDDLYTVIISDEDGILTQSDALGFRTDTDFIDSVAFFTNNGAGSFSASNIEVYSSAIYKGKSTYTVVTVRDGQTTTETGEYYNTHYITAPEIEGYTCEKTVDGTTVTFTYVKEQTTAISFVNESGEVVWNLTSQEVSAGDTVPAQEIFAITDSGSGFYQIPETVISTWGMTVTVSPVANKYAVIEDAFVQYGTLYGINTTNTNGLMIGSSADTNRGPEKDANGETTYLEGATPTTLGSTRVGLVKFPVVDIEEDEKATLKFYVRSWHQQGFDGGNTFLRIAVTPLADSSWAELSEGSSFTIASEPLLETWATPVFSEKAAKEVGYVSVDVTEMMHAAKNAGMEYISFKMQIYWGAAYCVEREAAVSGGSYEGKAAYIELEEVGNLYKVTTSGSATLTKNGSAMNGFAYVTENDDMRLQLSDAKVIGADSGYYMPNESFSVTENTDITNTISLGFGLLMVNGAQVRYGAGLDENGNVGSSNGLRFITTVDRGDTLAGLDDAEIGVIITAENSDNQTKIVAEKWQNDTTFTSALTNLAVSNYNRNFTATPYVTVGGKTFTGDSVTRSMYQVAAGLLVNGSTDNTEYEETTQILFDVLNAYVNQVGIRLTFSDNADFSDWELRANTDSKGSYKGDCFFEVGETTVKDKVYSVTLTPLGDKTVIKAADGYWNNYIRINNNNSQVKLCTTLTDNGDGTYTLSFDTAKLNLGTYPEEKYGKMKPTYERAVAAMELANTYWQTNQSYIDTYGSTHPAFWDKAAYHTGNIEMYKLTGNEDYLQYSIDWANYNEWKGNNSTSDPSTWTWGYNQTQGSNAVLFGDWQICFQTYIDLYDMGAPGATLDRVYEVIDYQISKEEDSFWWWADALYMVMPVMTKLYKQTGDEKYLDALYKYFKYAKELMYDGPGGIPTSADGYTTSASLNDGAYYSDPDDYKYLFYRDASYVYPLLPNSGYEDIKNFWSRGNGWVFAGLSKVLSDMPETYEHYDEFYTTYIEMAAAIIACQQVDSSGYGFWTQSMLQDYPKGTNDNDEGYETSGTAFFTYGLFWGINNGLLDEETYLIPAIRAWGYLENVALHEDGKVGYVQPIGSKATQAVSYDTTANFGVGAYLLASAEAARWAQAQ